MKQPFTLIDVQNGMFRMSLHTILTPPCFTFFWGLIQTANFLVPRFKNPFDLTVAQAFAAGGGNSRQSVNQKQKQLNKVRIDNQKLITITSGNKLNNVSAKYKISYKLLIPEMVDMPASTDAPSNIIDELITKWRRSGDGTLDDLMSFLRSDQKRSEETTTEAAVVLPSADEQNAETASDRLVVQGAVLGRYRSQIMDRLPSDPATTTLLELYPVHQILEALERMPLVLTPKDSRAVTGNYVLGKVDLWAKHPSWGVPDDGNGGVGQTMGERDNARAADVLVLMKEELVDLESRDGDWSDAILAQRVAIAEAEVG